MDADHRVVPPRAGTGPPGADPDASAAPRRRRIHGATLVVGAVGALIGALLAIATRQVSESNEQRLLDQRMAEATVVIQAALPTFQTPLAAGAELAEVADGADDGPFRRLMQPVIDSNQFDSASIWRIDTEADPAPLVVVGARPALESQPPEEIRAFLERSAGSSDLGVLGLLGGDRPRLGFSFVAVRTPQQPAARFVAYAEHPLRDERTSATRNSDAFDGLDSAIYLGDTASADRLLSSTTPELPLRGRHASRLVPFGDSTLLLVMAPTEHQGGRLLEALPWLLLAGGLLLAAAAAVLVERLLRSRDQAEHLAAENARLYAEQHRVAHTLQHSLLPASLPPVPRAELAVRYLAGVKGMEIGGDWYDALVVDEGRVLLVVGDVSGRGLRAASVMASLRFAARAFASDSAEPAAILRKLNDLAEPDPDGNFATVVCVLVDLDRRTASAATAGHPSPILLDERGGHFVETVPGPPIGVRPGATYEAVHVRLPATGSLLLFTDGLFERRSESIDEGLERLRASALANRHVADRDLDALLGAIALDLADGEAADDAAVLALRWLRPSDRAPAHAAP